MNEVKPVDLLVLGAGMAGLAAAARAAQQGARVVVPTGRAVVGRKLNHVNKRPWLGRSESAVYKAIGIWTWPRDADLESFEQHYETKHYPLAEKLPEIERITVLKAGADAREAGIYRVAEVYWPDEASFQRAATSPEWAEMARDAAGMMERYGVELKAAVGEEHEAQA